MNSHKSTNSFLDVNGQRIGLDYPTYFIADIAANHDGNLEKAKELITLAKEAGADAAKFQHFRADRIVSQRGFDSMTNQLSHQSKWKKSVVEVYRDASVPWEWTAKLKQHAEKVKIHFFSAPYDLEAIDMLDAYMPAYKVGSGDITWLEALERIAKKGKPVFLATGASDFSEVKVAVELIRKYNSHLCLMQCNTNYTGSLENFRHVHLNVLKTYKETFPQTVLGLSDHTPGHATVLGAVTLGARAVEKHFTNDRSQIGPDHGFSMNPREWREMVDRTRELELALGSCAKTVAENEQETVYIQRRCLRASKDICAGTVIRREDIDVLRPVQKGALTASQISMAVGKKSKRNLSAGEALFEGDLES